MEQMNGIDETMSAANGNYKKVLWVGNDTLRHSLAELMHFTLYISLHFSALRYTHVLSSTHVLSHSLTVPQRIAIIGIRL